MRDYEVKTSVVFHTGFDDRECNCLMLDGMKKKIVEEIKAGFESDRTLRENITSDLAFSFQGYKAKVEYTFSCNDENEAEAESFSAYCLQNIKEKLQEQGYCIKQVTCKASEMDMEWLDKLEGMWFG